MATALPSIDLEPFIASSGQGRQAVPRAIAQACEEVGFFKIRGHGLPQTLIDTAFATASDFFGQPQAIKDLSRPPKSASARGYHALLTKNLAKTLGYDNPPDLRPRQPRRRIRSYPRRRRALRREYLAASARDLPPSLHRILHGAGEPRWHADAHIRPGVGSR
jgi:isopenicillin N synthase-like dioxygenase